MSGRNRLAAFASAFVLAAAFAVPATAQAVASAPLAQVDPWGVGWLGKADAPVASTFWSNTDAAMLAPLYADLKPPSLSWAARQALRRIVLSATKAPAGGEPDLIPERLRLIEQLGDADHAIDLRKRFPKAAWSAGADRLAADMELVSGRNETACGRVAAQRADDPNWMSARALCYVIAKDLNAAGLVAEQIDDVAGKAAQDEDKNALWLVSAVESLQAAKPPGKTDAKADAKADKAKPPGRYGTAFEAAVSIAAKLSAPVNAMAATPPDVALAIVRHPLATSEQKHAALRIAIDTGRLTPTEVLAVVMVPPDTASEKSSGDKPAARAGQRPAADFLALALAAATNTELGADAKSAAYAAALKAGDTPADARIAAYALHDALKALAKTEASAPNAETFARAGLMTNDVKLAQDWRKLMDTSTGDKADPWAAARIDLMMSFLSGDEAKSTSLLNRLIDASPLADEKPFDPKPADAKSKADPKADSKTAAKQSAKTEAKSANSAQRQLDLRRIETTRVLFLYVGAGRPLAPAARALLAEQKTAGRGVPDAVLARIAAAEDQNALGEAALAAIAQLGADTSALSFSGLADLLTALRRANLDKDADALALESLQVWKAL